jgi:hypothetical protein
LFCEAINNIATAAAAAAASSKQQAEASTKVHI